MVMKEAIKPNLIQTLEHNPVIMHLSLIHIYQQAEHDGHDLIVCIERQ